ncbi:ABC transporter ATP-binding protein [Hoeflea poritis]|uniref:Sn-glycerol-3-phosphate ABC transporter ATP-binding protein UgpC n=1 Tax=Hoeflea poritis TaxID=2993659 RepID=A0ABT4VHW7_9HYPH|nr:sn-glycerol-3-phosphate ABC transporter ATP-binding protein UgpC [Hoeflea poritis]MDA4844194.1 sn-glycerol-3-phosphate ABC transporter ATP-binding protein UgpC [Hoeflea poritis]
MGSIRLENVEKWFGDVQVIKGVDLDIADGEFVIFVGPSGCGKSTLLRMISGLEETSRGRILLDDVDVTAEPPSGRKLSMVFQSYALYPHMTVGENMGFGLKTAGEGKAQIASKVDEAARVLKLDALLDRRPKALSGGQRQRVAIGRAIVREPKGFLFDEPLSNLDAALRVEMRLEIARLHQNLSTTMIYVTHDQVEAMTLADRIVVLKDGLIMQVGTPRELYENPNSLFVAQFIGSPKMNIMPASADGQRFTVSGHGSGTHTLGEEANVTASLGIRPEHIALASGEDAHCTGTVEVAEYLGADTYLYVNCAGLDTIVVRRTGAETVRHGETVGLKFNEPDIHLFNGEGRSVSAA